MPHIAKAAVASRNCSQYPAMGRLQKCPFTGKMCQGFNTNSSLPQQPVSRDGYYIVGDRVVGDSTGHCNGPRPLKSTRRHWHFLNSTCDIRLSDMQQGLKIIVTWDVAFS